MWRFLKKLGIKLPYDPARRRQWHPTPVLLPGKSHGRRSLVGCSPWVAKSRTRLSNFTFTFHFHALEKDMATHSTVLAWRIPGTEEPGRRPSMGSHRVGHDWSNLRAAAAWPSNPTTGHIPWENHYWKRCMHPNVHVALFTIARTWKQPKCLSTEAWDKEDVVHENNGMLLSHKKEWNNVICSNTDGPRDCHTKTER